MNSQKQIASLSLDLDNQWSYLKVHGDPAWQSFPSYLELVVGRVLEFLKRRQLQITFFIVGQDAALQKNHAALRAIAQAGHEIGNHSFSHEPWFHLYSRTQIEEEISRAEEAILDVTAQRPIGFRGPGFSFSETTIEVLEQRGYLYDASTFPTFIGPLARFYYFFKSDLTKDERQKRSSLFGSLRNGFRPLKPYNWQSQRSLLEIPVTTMPVFRLPIHVSYLLYLASFSSTVALSYFRTALALCRANSISPSLLIHPLDFLGCDDGVGLDFFPAMKLSSARKLNFVEEALATFSESFRVGTLSQHAAQISERLRRVDGSRSHRISISE